MSFCNAWQMYILTLTRITFNITRAFNLCPADHDYCLFYPSARWAQRGIVVPFVRRRRHTHSFGYYTNMVQQIKFIIHTNIQPLRALFYTQGQGHRSKIKGQGQRFKKILVNAIT